MHGTLNGTAVMLIKGGNDLTTVMTGLAGFLSLVAVLGFLFIYERYIGKHQLMTNRIDNSLNFQPNKNRN
ncbi:MAG: hypothetical protein ACQEQ0_07180 [Bacteroidota bacterium]